MFDDIFKDILGDFEKPKKETEPKDWNTGKNTGSVWNTGKNENIWKVVNGKKDGIPGPSWEYPEEDEDEEDECKGCSAGCSDDCTI